METSFIETTPLLKVSEMAENLIGSEIIKLAGEVKARIANGEQIYNFTIGDFNPEIFPIPTELREEIIKAYQEGHTNYPAANGLPELRKAISRYLHIRGGLEYNEEQILVSGGARPLIYATYQTVIDPGDTVIFPVPSWNNNHYCHLTQAKPVFIDTNPSNHFMPTAADIKPHLSGASMVALCSPQNPTGTMFNREQLEEICLLILEENKRRGENKKPVYLLFDQIYWALTHNENLHFDPVSLVPEMKNYTIYIDGMSKAFASTGVRVGWAFGPYKVMQKMKSILGHIGAWSPKAEQVATSRYLSNDDAIDQFLDSFKKEISDRLKAFYEGIMELKRDGFKVDAIAPQAAMYLTVQFNLQGMHTESGERLANTRDVTAYILSEGKAALVPFYCFGAGKTSNWYRLSVGTASKEDIQGFFTSIRAALEKLN